MGIAVVNLGLKSIRCIIFDECGRKLAFAAHPVHTYLRANEVEQDAEEWLELLGSVVRSAVGQVRREEIQALTVTTSASCLVPVDANGRPTHRVLMVSDSRNTKEADDLTHRARALGEPVGRVTTDLLVSKILWLKRHRPDVFAATRYFLSAADFLNLYFTGCAVTDPLNASKFLAGEVRPGEYAYPDWILTELGLDADRLPVVYESGQRIGTVRREAAGACGLPAETEVYISTYDAICAVLGSGVAIPGRAAVVSGTVTSVRALATGTPAEPPTGVYRGSWVEAADPGERFQLVGGSNNLGGGLIEWHKQAFYQDCPEDPYLLMDRESRSVAPGAEGLIFLPYLLGERAPIWDPEARGIFFGLDRRHTRSHFTKAVFESVAFSSRHILEHILKLGQPISDVRFSGGLARIPAVGQILADVLQRPVAIPAEFETTSVGAYLITAVAMGRYRSFDEACASVVGLAESYEPRHEFAELYDALFSLYLRLYEETGAIQAMRRDVMERFRGLLDAHPTARENL
jgi:xylulokinase